MIRMDVIGNRTIYIKTWNDEEIFKRFCNQLTLQGCVFGDRFYVPKSSVVFLGIVIENDLPYEIEVKNGRDH